jgi:sulfate/thiosulfate transport system substrate-binding protein
MKSTIRTLPGALAALLLVVAAAGCGGTSGASSGNSISLVAYSTPKEAYQEIIPAFQKTAAGKGVKFSQSYGASGEQSRAVQNGLPADVVAFSLAPDVSKLVDKGIVDANWDKDRWGGFVTNSVVVLTVRKGNPKHIRTWDDLLRPGIQVITPNPFTSGGAKWNIMAAYGAQIEQGRSEAEATQYLEKLFHQVAVQDKSAREALQTFAAGKGDVLISYENEAITAQQKGEAVDYVVPDQTIMIQNPIAVTKDAKKGAKAFVAFARSDAAQRIFAARGYRSINPALVDAKTYPTPSGLFRIDRFGGWSAVNKKFFDPNGIVGKIEQGLGVATGK